VINYQVFHEMGQFGRPNVISTLANKGKGKGSPRTGHEGPEGE
jgi:hypothetical protein